MLFEQLVSRGRGRDGRGRVYSGRGRDGRGRVYSGRKYSQSETLSIGSVITRECDYSEKDYTANSNSHSEPEAATMAVNECNTNADTVAWARIL